ncbi:MAG: acetate--CoA ligase family protein [Thermodesulfobacteriota bacterium]
MNHARPVADMARFFYPESIVVIGVSPDRANLGKNIVQNCLDFGFAGEIVSVGIKEGIVFGQRIHPSVESIDLSVDLAVILTPAQTVPEILSACGRKGIRRVVIESGGFSELGEEGAAIEQACVKAAEAHGIRFIGPNGIGLSNLENGLILPFWPMREDLKPGPVSVLAQSGGVGLSYLGFLAEESIGVNKFVSMGNKLDVDENDLLEYLIQDEGTRIILLYLEGFTNGKRFVDIASRSEKPILVHKSNRFEASSSIAHSHTTAMFTNDMLVNDALEQAGCIRVNTMNEAMDYMKGLSMPPLRGNRIAVVSRSGGHAVITADACAHYGFELPDFPPELLKKVESRLRAHVIRLQNPLDLGDLFDLDFYEHIVEEMLKRDDLDGVLLGHGYRRGFEQDASRTLIERISELASRYGKPVALTIFAEAMEIDYLKRHYDIPVFTAPENAMRAFDLSRKWFSPRPGPLVGGRTPRLEGIDQKSVQAILERGVPRGELLLSEGLDLLLAAGFNLPRHRLARTPDEAVEAMSALGTDVVMKLNRPHISHKTDQGAVLMGLTDEKDVRSAFPALQEAAGRKDVEVLVQEMGRGGLEVIIGGKRDVVFGPVVMFGIGGVLVEVLGDTVWGVAPLDPDQASRMMKRIRGRRLLEGIRRKPPRDAAAVEDMIVRLSRLMADFPAIQEMDVNPVLVDERGKGATAVDARVILNGSAS